MRTGLLLLLTFSIYGILSGQSIHVLGFYDSNAIRELKTEKAFDEQISRENIGKTIQDLSSVPHNLGSSGSKEVAEKIQQKFRDYGFDVHMDVYQVLFPVPKIRVLEMTAPNIYHALLKEPALKEDGTSGQKDQLPTYNAWSADGNVTGRTGICELWFE